MPSLGAQKRRIVYLFVDGVFRSALAVELVGEGLEIVFAVHVALVGRKLVPAQGFTIVLSHSLPILVHPAELV